MATLNISQDDALRGFKVAADLNNTDKSNPLANLKNYVWGASGSENSALPYAYKDAQHTTTTESPSSAPFMSWPTWATLSTQTPWYETMGLTRTQRYVAFSICVAAALVLTFIAFIHLPMSVLFPGKFVLPLCLANLFLFTSFGFLHGFASYGRHLISKDRWPFTAFFFGSTFATLYVAYAIHFYPLTLIFAVLQGVSTFAYVVSYVPGGASGLAFVGSSIRSRITGGL